MSLSIPIHEFSRLRLVANMSATGNMSLSLQPLEGVSQTPKDFHAPDVSLHFDSTCENGINALSVYVSFTTPLCKEEPAPQATQPQNGTSLSQCFRTARLSMSRQFVKVLLSRSTTATSLSGLRNIGILFSRTMRPTLRRCSRK